ncbi:MAG: XdhC family protein [Gemmatimonadota bacterium]|nr:XdhC family protein [Gemmatimonadota bacterium]
MAAAPILAECARLAAGGGTGALASVARRRGSLPMSGTAKMLVTTSGGGARVGTVGGGCLEAEIIERAIDVAECRRPCISEHTLNAEAAGDYGLTCGGTAMMLIEPVYGDSSLVAIYDACTALMSRGSRAVMATSYDWSAGIAKLLLGEATTVGTAAPELVAAALAYDPLAELPELREGVLIEAVAGSPRLVVFGGGHVGARVAEAAAFAGWRVTVADDRPEFADATRLPFAESAVVCEYHALPESLAIDAATYVVVATRGHQHDALVVEQIARLDTRYLGMLGSRRKVALTWRLLEMAGVPRERLQRVRAPVGLSIGADTPEEIAISVVAEMVAVRRAGSRRRGGVDGPAGEEEGVRPGISPSETR